MLRTDMEDDNVGQYGAIVESAGMAAVDLKNMLVYGALWKGFTTPCYDEQPFFDADHPVYPNEDGSGAPISISNVQDGNGPPWVLLCTKRSAAPLYLQERMPVQFESKTSAATSDDTYNLDVYSFGGRWRGEAAYGFWQCAFGSKAELNAANFNAAYAAMMKFKGDGGRPLGLAPDLLVTGPDNMAAAELLLKAQQNPNGASNTNYKKVDLFVTPWFAEPMEEE
jgi:phage major head subunit gpT-like protein